MAAAIVSLALDGLADLPGKFGVLFRLRNYCRAGYSDAPYILGKHSLDQIRWTESCVWETDVPGRSS